MEKQQNQQPVVQVLTVKPKSNAPWILGIIAVCTSLPNVLCAAMCAGVVAAATGATSEADAERAAGRIAVLMVVSAACFILSFFGKSKISVITGILMLAGGLYIVATAFLGYGNWIWGLVSGVLYAIGGGISISNRKRSK